MEMVKHVHKHTGTLVQWASPLTLRPCFLPHTFRMVDASIPEPREAVSVAERKGEMEGRLCGKKCWCWAVGGLPGQKTAVEQGLATVWDRKQFSHAPLCEPQSTITAHVSGKAWVFHPTKQD